MGCVLKVTKPQDIFTAGALRLCHSGSPALDFFDGVPETYGIDEEGLSAQEEVEIPSTLQKHI